MAPISTTSKRRLPVQPYTTGEFLRFGQRIRRRLVLWATHLGDDVAVAADAPVHAIGPGTVVLAKMQRGSKARRAWGGVVILKHKLQEQTVYSVYGHMTDLKVDNQELVEAGQQLGVVAKANTPENGMWRNAHLHFAIYTGPFDGRLLPGYARPDDWVLMRPRRTRKKWWHDPRDFIDRYNREIG